MPSVDEIHVSLENLAACQVTLSSLKERRADILHMIITYPVMCSFAQNKRMIENGDDLDRLTNDLEFAISNFSLGERSLGSR